MTKQEFITNTMEDVILTTRQARELVFKDGEVQEHTEDDLAVAKTVIAANKNLVSASIVLMSAEKLNG